MAGLSQDQEETRAGIEKSAKILGGIVGVIAGLLALWLLGGMGGAIRYGGAIVIAGAVGYLVYSASFKAGAKSALCAKCGAAFSRSQTDHAETVTASTEKDTREEQADKSVKVTTWIEDSLDVVDTYTCAKCGDVTTEAYQTTRRRDEKTVIEPIEPAKNVAAKAGKWDAADAAADEKPRDSQAASKGKPVSAKTDEGAAAAAAAKGRTGTARSGGKTSSKSGRKGTSR